MADSVQQEAAALSELAAALYLKAPSGEILAEMQELFPDLQEFGAEPLDLLLQEYHELFFNPASPRFLSPFESFARHQRYWSECAIDVGEIYQEAGFDPKTLLSEVHWKDQRMPDHIGFELSFFSALLKSAEAQPMAAKALLETAQNFHTEHIRSWVGDFGTRLKREAQTSLYCLLGDLTREVAEISLVVSG